MRTKLLRKARKEVQRKYSIKERNGVYYLVRLSPLGDFELNCSENVEDILDKIRTKIIVTATLEMQKRGLYYKNTVAEL